MNITITKYPSKDTKKLYYSLEWGRGKGQRRATGVFTYTNPADKIQRDFNREALAILETKKSQLILERQTISTGYVPQHKFKNNFLDYYSEFVTNNKTAGNRHLEGSFTHFKLFLKSNFLAPADITPNLCERFRKYLLDCQRGSTPASYFGRFRRVMKNATRDGYFRLNPCEEVKAKSNKDRVYKEFLEADEYLKLMNAPCLFEEVRDAFIFCCYTGLRWCDVKMLRWKSMMAESIIFRINQVKTTREVTVTLHQVAKTILDKRWKRLKDPVMTAKIFALPSQERALRILDQWCRSAGLKKHITWHSARLSFSILLQDANVDAATVALLLGQSTSRLVQDTYKRFRPKDQQATYDKLPKPHNKAEGLIADAERNVIFSDASVY